MPRTFRLQHRIFRDEAAARRALEDLRWPKGVSCPRCACVEVAENGRCQAVSPGWPLSRCKKCRGQFTVTVGTVFHRSKVPLHKWMQIVHLEGNAPSRGHNSWQMSLATEITHKTVEKMRARIYAAVGQYDGPNNVFGRRIGGYVRAQRPESYELPPKPFEREVEDYSDPYAKPRRVLDFRNWYAWRQRKSLGAAD